MPRLLHATSSVSAFHDASDSAPWLSEDTEAQCAGEGALPVAEPLSRAAPLHAPRLAPPPFTAHAAAFRGDVPAVVAEMTRLHPDDRLALDPRGHTVLHVAALVGSREVLTALLSPPLSLPPAPRTPDGGWTPLDVAASEGHDACARLLAEAAAAAAKADRAARRAQLASLLAACPDYTFRVKWELTSPLLGPLLRACAPGDTYRVTKKGSSVRVDGELRGLASGGGGGILPEWRRGPFSVVWRAAADAARTVSVDVDEEAEDKAEGDDTTPPPPANTWILIDREANSYLDLAAEHRARRARAGPRAAASAALAAGGRRTKITAAGAHLVPCRGWLGGAAREERVAGLKAAPYEARVALAAVDASRGSWHLPKGCAFDTYLAFEPPPDARAEMAIDPLGAAGVPGRPGGKAVGGSVAPPHHSAKPLTARVWMARETPLSSDQLFALLDVAGGANKHLSSAGRIARRLGGDAAAQGLLPVKLVVPLAWTVAAAVTVLDIQPLSADHAAATDPTFFALPAGCRLKGVDELRTARAKAAAAVLAARGPAAVGGPLPAPPKTPGRGTLNDGFEDLHF